MITAKQAAEIAHDNQIKYYYPNEIYQLIRRTAARGFWHIKLDGKRCSNYLLDTLRDAGYITYTTIPTDKDKKSFDVTVSWILNDHVINMKEF